MIQEFLRICYLVGFSDKFAFRCGHYSIFPVSPNALCCAVKSSSLHDCAIIVSFFLLLILIVLMVILVVWQEALYGKGLSLSPLRYQPESGYFLHLN